MARKTKKIKFSSTSKQRTRSHRNISKILKERNQTVAQLMQLSNNQNDNINITLNSENSLREESFRDKLTNWINVHNISKRAVNHLLSILNSDGGHVLPKDYRTLLKTDTNVEIISLAGGFYWYNGLKKCLVPILNNFNEDAKLSLNFNIDGLPLYKSSKQTFWPILANIHGDLFCLFFSLQIIREI